MFVGAHSFNQPIGKWNVKNTKRNKYVHDLIVKQQRQEE